MGLKLIGITGKARAGKDTFARILVEDHGFKRMAFADPVKVASAIIFGWPIEQVFDDSFKTFRSDYWGLTVREAFQRVGTEAIRGEFGDDHWIKRWLLDYSRVKDIMSVVVSDVRSEAEAEAIRSLGGMIVHLHRDKAGLQGSEGQHSSEAGIAFGERDINIDNNGALHQLENQVHILIQFIEKHAAETGLRNEMAPAK